MDYSVLQSQKAVTAHFSSESYCFLGLHENIESQNINPAVQSKKAVTAYLKSKQLLPFVFAGYQMWIISGVTVMRWASDHGDWTLRLTGEQDPPCGSGMELGGPGGVLLLPVPQLWSPLHRQRVQRDLPGGVWREQGHHLLGGVPTHRTTGAHGWVYRA